MKARNSGPYISEGLNRPGLESSVLAAMSRVPRHRFVPDYVADSAYEDRALPIEHGQTISQPYIVALMTQEAGIGPDSKVLEVGTGSGYQAAVLAEMGAEVFSIEVIPELAAEARKTLNELGYSTVKTRVGDGWAGWEEESPYAAILVTASAPSYPPKLLDQLAQGGRLIIPIEDRHGLGETLMLVQRSGDDYVSRKLGAVKFVPLTGELREKETVRIQDPTKR